MEDKSISQIRRDATNPINKTETDKILIKIEAFTWLYPLSISLWCKCLLSGRNGEFPDFALKI